MMIAFTPEEVDFFVYMMTSKGELDQRQIKEQDKIFKSFNLIKIDLDHPLVFACEKDDELEAMKELKLLKNIDPPIDINENFTNHEMSLLQASFLICCIKNNFKLVTLLLDFSQFLVIPYGIHNACFSGNTDLAMYIMDFVNLNFEKKHFIWKSDWKSDICFESFARACCQGKLDLVENFLEHNFDFEYRSNLNFTLIEELTDKTMSRRDKEILSRYKYSAFDFSCMFGNKETLDFLISQGHDIFVDSVEGEKHGLRWVGRFPNFYDWNSPFSFSTNSAYLDISKARNFDYLTKRYDQDKNNHREKLNHLFSSFPKWVAVTILKFEKSQVLSEEQWSKVSENLTYAILCTHFFHTNIVHIILEFQDSYSFEYEDF